MKGITRKRLKVGVCALSLLLSFTPAEIALAKGQQHDAHVQTWRQEQSKNQQHDAHVQLWLQEQAKNRQHDAHVQTWLKDQAGKVQHDAHVQAWLKDQAAKKPEQHDAHVQQWLKDQAKKPEQHDAHVQQWLKDQAKKYEQHDAHVQQWLKEQGAKLEQHDAHVETWRNYEPKQIAGDCSEFVSAAIDGQNAKIITIASIASNISADCSEYLQNDHKQYCQCQYDKASAKQNSREKISPEDLRQISQKLRWFHKEQTVGDKFNNLMKDYIKVSKNLLFALSDPNLSDSVNKGKTSCTPNGIQDFFKSMTELGPKVCTSEALARLSKSQRNAHYRNYENCLAKAPDAATKFRCDREFELDDEKLEKFNRDKAFIGPSLPTRDNGDFGAMASRSALRHYHKNYVASIEDVYNHTYPDKKVDLLKLSFDEMNKELIRIKQELSNDTNVEAITIVRERKFYGQNLKDGQESFANSLITAFMIWEKGGEDKTSVKYHMALTDVSLILGDNPLFSKFKDENDKIAVDKLFEQLKLNMRRVRSVNESMQDSEAMARSLLLIQEEEVKNSESICNNIKREMIGACSAEQNDCASVADIKIPQNMEDIEAFLKDDKFTFQDGSGRSVSSVLGKLSCIPVAGNSYAGIDKKDFLSAILNGKAIETDYSILDQNNACSQEKTEEAIFNSGLVEPELIGPSLPNQNSVFYRELAGAYKTLEGADFSQDALKNYFNNDGSKKTKSGDNISVYADPTPSSGAKTAALSSGSLSGTLSDTTSVGITPSRISNLAVANENIVVSNNSSNNAKKFESRRKSADEQERERYLSELDELKKEKASFNKEKDDYTKNRIAELEKRIEELKKREGQMANVPESVETYKAEAKPAPVGGQIASTSSSFLPKDRSSVAPTPSATVSGGDVSMPGVSGGGESARGARSPASAVDSRGSGTGQGLTGALGNDGQNGITLTSIGAPIFLEARDLKELKSEDLQKFVTDANKNGVLSVTLADKKTYLIPVKDGQILIGEAKVQTENVAGVQNEADKLDEKQLEEMASLHPELICTLYPSLGREIPEGIKCDNVAK